MSYKLTLMNATGEITGYSKVDKEDYEKFSAGFWHLRNDGYTSGKFGKLKGLLHRLIMNAEKGDLCVDHINHDRLDNQKNNLRFVSASQNAQNKSKAVNATSSYYGVYKIKNSNNWACSINSDSGLVRHIFKTEIHAAYYYDIIAVAYRGSNAQINKLEKPDDFEIPVKKQLTNKKNS